MGQVEPNTPTQFEIEGVDLLLQTEDEFNEERPSWGCTTTTEEDKEICAEGGVGVARVLINAANPLMGLTIHHTCSLRGPLSQEPPVTCWKGILKALADEDTEVEEILNM